MQAEIVKPAPPPGFRWKVERDYSQGSLRQRVRSARTKQELAEVLQEVVVVARSKRLSRGELLKLDRAVKARRRALESQLVVLPERPRLVLP